jgi:6-phospho-beta-glucosidase
MIADLAPGAWVLNLTNPCDLVSRALREAGCPRVLGLCEHAQVFMDYLAGMAGRPDEGSRFDFLGIMHVGWASPPPDMSLALFERWSFQIAGWRPDWKALPTQWRIHLSDPDALAGIQRESPEQRAAMLTGLVGTLRASIRGGNIREYQASIGQRELAWFPQAVVPAIRALLGGEPARLVTGLPNGRRLPGLHPNLQVDGWAVVNERGVVPEECAVSQPCREDIINFGRTRELAYDIALRPDRESLDRYAQADPFSRGIDLGKDLKKTLRLTDNRTVENHTRMPSLGRNR